MAPCAAILAQSAFDTVIALPPRPSAIGAIVFVSFLMLCVRQLYLGRDDPFLLGMAAVAAAFMAMSLTGEFLYQRHLWFLLGMALALPHGKPASR